ncbi:hypothetical protein [Nocardia goodfellowii]|uniref:NADH:ubiquinone oxidoreductase subunit K n=1 Tax=Nocardia goodfellowii TaxID=882446 RepID=A0ABS4Q8T5_9NOCA|nr:hypothetical protein [Nocardia goodfellowii]MBP2188103.1 NADH:ubiquinone oxidoreductase subunit K [Nocardia goodfellowii]
MGYPQYDGGYQPYATGPGWEPAPGGGTAITAGVLAALGAVAQLISGAGVLGLGLVTSDVFDEEDGLYAFVLVSAGFSLLTGVLLGIGAVTLFLRKKIGRVLVAVACAIHILAQIVSFVVATTAVGEYSGGADLLGAGVGGLIAIVFPIATLILVLLPSTARWLAYQPAAAGYPPPYGSGYPPAGYPQQNSFAPNQFGGFAQAPFGHVPAPGLPEAPPAQRVDGFADAPTQVAPWSNGASPSPPANPFEKPDDGAGQRPG